MTLSPQGVVFKCMLMPVRDSETGFGDDPNPGKLTATKSRKVG